MDVVLLSTGENLSIGPLDGSRLVKSGKDVFKKICLSGFSKNVLSDVGAPTPETLVDVYQHTYFGASFEKILNSLPGKWNQKFLTQNQVIEFCLIYKRWLSLYSEATVFVCKKDEREPIDENNPEENLSLVYVNYDGRNLTISITSILEFDVWNGEGLIRIVLPRV